MTSPLSHQQLAMYMTADELRKVAHNSYGKEGAERILKEKLSEAKNETDEGWGHGLYEDIKHSGEIYEPVILRHSRGEEHPDIFEGHHRIAVANALNPKMIVPVEHFEG